MPLSITVGLSRKASKDFQSTGVLINVTAELDQALLARPQELQQQIDALYAQAEAALDRQAGVSPAPPAKLHRPMSTAPMPAASPQEEPRRAMGPRAGGNGGGNGHGRYASRANGNGTGQPANGARSGGGNGAPMTDSQRRAILAIAERLSLDAQQEIQDMFGWELDQLSLKQASQVIDHLKAQHPTGSGR